MTRNERSMHRGGVQEVAPGARSWCIDSRRRVTPRESASWRPLAMPRRTPEGAEHPGDRGRDEVVVGRSFTKTKSGMLTTAPTRKLVAPSTMPASSSGAGTSRSERVALPMLPFMRRPMTPPST